MGTVTREMVETRARELAMINGRDPHHFTDSDWVAAKQELLGITAAEEDIEGEGVAGLTSWDEDPGSSGKHIPNNAPQDEQTFAEQLVKEGIEEAEHEQMVESTRRQENQDMD
jgi:hypothetical protein